MERETQGILIGKNGLALKVGIEARKKLENFFKIKFTLNYLLR